MSQREDLQKLIAKHHRYLQVLKEQQADFGLECPPHIIIGIEETEAKIAELQAELNGGVAPEIARSNLPRQPYFFGREQELAEIAAALAPESRTWGVLIDGPGGIGKTALAIRAGELAPVSQFPRKIFLSAKVRELTPAGEQPLEDYMLPNFMALLTELARELGDDSIGKTDPAQRPKIVRDLLVRERALLLIDNLETFDEKERVRLYQFLDRLPLSCKAIVTSRRRTDINARSLRLERLSREAALELMAELARSNPRLARTTSQEREELYGITNGNPLLIRWLAGQLGREGSQCRTIAAACQFMEATPADNDPLEYIFGDLLDTFTEAETAVLAALSHFSQPAKVEWIASLADQPHLTAQTALEDLADRALLVADAEAKTFFLPRLAGLFLRNKHPQLVTECGNRLTDRVFALVMENGFDKHDRFPILEANWPTIAAALPLLVQGDNARLQRVCAALRNFLNFSGRWDEQLTLNQQAEEKALTVNDFYNAGWRAYEVGWIHQYREPSDEVLACTERVEMHWRQANAGAREHAFALRLRGLGYQLKQDYSAARAAYQEALELWRTLSPESAEVAIGLHSLAMIEHLTGDYSATERNYQEALRISRKIGDRESIALRLGNLATLALDRQDLPAGESMAREALSLAEMLGRQELIASNCRRIALALTRQGRPQEGLPYALRAVEIYTHLRHRDLEKAQATLRECEGGLDHERNESQ